MILRKFQFPDQQTAIALLGDPSQKPGINEPTLPYVKNQVVLGHIELEPAVYDGEDLVTPPVISESWHVDVVFESEVPAELVDYLVWPEPNGYHNVPGLEESYANAYQLIQTL